MAAWGSFANPLVCSDWPLGSCHRLDESLPEAQRLRLPLWQAFRSYLIVFRNRHFVVMMLLIGFSSAALMAYISASPFLFQNHFGLTPMQYSLCFAGNAVGLVAGSTALMRLSDLRRATALSVGGLMRMSLLWRSIAKR